MYYIPGQTVPPSPEARASLGLSHVDFTTCRQCRVLQNGPDGGGGIIIDAGRGPAPLCKLDAQTWTQGPGGRWWYGYWAEERPTPATMLRKRIDGYPVRLRDGNDWLVAPAVIVGGDATTPTLQTALPRLIGFDPATGSPTVGDVVPEARRFAEIADLWWAWRFTPEKPDLTVDWLVSASIDVLSRGYAVGIVECSALGLLDVEAAKEVLDALIDVPGLREFEKKTAAGDSGTNSGEPG